MEMPHVSNTGIDMILDKLEADIAERDALREKVDVLRAACDN